MIEASSAQMATEKINVRSLRFLRFIRTNRADETGSTGGLSVKKAQEAGFKV